ncbi:hypothetical protein Tco_1253687 [Tanacetum coccineum]
MQTKTELTLEQTQQGVSDEVLVSIKGVEELKRKVKINGEKKEALLTLRQKPEHQSDTKVLTMTMEILLDLTSNKLCGSDEVFKLKNFKKDGYTRFQHQEQYEHVSPRVTRSQEGKDYKTVKRNYAWLMILRSSKITYKSRQRYKLKPKSLKIATSRFTI